MVAGPDTRGGSFYDDEATFEAYSQHRHAAVTSPNLVMEDPAFRAAVDPLAGLDILDLGCGDGGFAAACVDAGCSSYVGIDGSERMIAAARATIADPAVRFVRSDLEDLDLGSQAFDLVVSRMALHYVSDIAPVLARASAATRSTGRLVVSVIHPVLTAGNRAPGGPRTSQVVDDYFVPGPRERLWFASSVVWQHRTIEHYVDAVIEAGYRLDRLRECEPVESLFHGNAAEYERRRMVPVFLLLAASVDPNRG